MKPAPAGSHGARPALQVEVDLGRSCRPAGVRPCEVADEPLSIAPRLPGVSGHDVAIAGLAVAYLLVGAAWMTG
jgi:hypothetical protein